MTDLLSCCIGMSTDCAMRVLAEHGYGNVRVVLNVDRKQTKFDKELVTAVRQFDDVVELVVCRYLFVVE